MVDASICWSTMTMIKYDNDHNNHDNDDHSNYDMTDSDDDDDLTIISYEEVNIH